MIVFNEHQNTKILFRNWQFAANETKYSDMIDTKELDSLGVLVKSPATPGFQFVIQASFDNGTSWEDVSDPIPTSSTSSIYQVAQLAPMAGSYPLFELVRISVKNADSINPQTLDVMGLVAQRKK